MSTQEERTRTRGLPLIIIGILIMGFIGLATFYVGVFTLPMLALGVTGLITAGVGAQRRWG